MRLLWSVFSCPVYVPKRMGRKKNRSKILWVEKESVCVCASFVSFWRSSFLVVFRLQVSFFSLASTIICLLPCSSFIFVCLRRSWSIRVSLLVRRWKSWETKVTLWRVKFQIEFSISFLLSSLKSSVFDLRHPLSKRFYVVCMVFRVVRITKLNCNHRIASEIQTYSIQGTDSWVSAFFCWGLTEAALPDWRKVWG